MGGPERAECPPQGRKTSTSAIACKAMRFGMTRVEPSSRISSLSLHVASSRVTVSREDPIIWAISSWVKFEATRRSRLRGSLATQESRSRASFSVELRASSRSWTSRKVVPISWLSSRAHVQCGVAVVIEQAGGSSPCSTNLIWQRLDRGHRQPGRAARRRPRSVPAPGDRLRLSGSPSFRPWLRPTAWLGRNR